MVRWSEELLNQPTPVTPRDVFGNKLEALDSIRAEDEVWITLLPHQDPPWQAEIQGFEMTNVELAEAHYGNLVRKAQIRRAGGSSSTTIILDEAEGSEIQLHEADGWWPNRAYKIVPCLLISPIDGPGSFRSRPLHPLNITEIEQEFRRSLEAVRFEQGSFDLTIRFGSLCLDGLEAKEIGKNYPLASFKKSIEGKVSCKTKKW